MENISHETERTKSRGHCFFFDWSMLRWTCRMKSRRYRLKLVFNLNPVKAENCPFFLFLSRFIAFFGCRSTGCDVIELGDRMNPLISFFSILFSFSLQYSAWNSFSSLHSFPIAELKRGGSLSFSLSFWKIGFAINSNVGLASWLLSRSKGLY